MSSTASEIKDQLRNVLSLRYDVETKLLNLSALGEDAILNQMGFFSGESKPEKLFRALMAVCDGLFKTAQEKRDAVSSISLAGNNINDVVQIMSLSDTFPDLVNLDLSRNQFKDLKALQKWRHRLRKLQTLLLNENPLEVTDPNYGAEITTWFPKLQNLSGIQVRTPEQIASMVTPEPVAQPPVAQPPVAQPPVAQPPVTQPNAEVQQQQQMLIELCTRTGMTPEYSKLCLDGANWNFDQAMNLFNEKRVSIPLPVFWNETNANDYIGTTAS